MDKVSKDLKYLALPTMLPMLLKPSLASLSLSSVTAKGL
jgi:hypothetical protein